MPSAQEIAAAVSGLPPNSLSSSGLSTDARIAVPMRVLVSSRYSPTATATELRIVMTCCAVTIDSPICQEVSAKNGSTKRASEGHCFCASPMTPTNMPTVTMRPTPTGASPSPRAMNRWITTPIAGATTPSTSTSAQIRGRPCETVSSQNTNDISIPKAPWAMLNTRVVV